MAANVYRACSKYGTGGNAAERRSCELYGVRMRCPRSREISPLHRAQRVNSAKKPMTWHLWHGQNGTTARFPTIAPDTKAFAGPTLKNDAGSDDKTAILPGITALAEDDVLHISFEYAIITKGCAAGKA